MSGWVAAAAPVPAVPSIFYRPVPQSVRLMLLLGQAVAGSSFRHLGFWPDFVSITLPSPTKQLATNGLFGDFFALDDIYFAEACSASDEVMVDVVEVRGNFARPPFLTCNSLREVSCSTTGVHRATALIFLINGQLPAAIVFRWQYRRRPWMRSIYTLTVNFNNGSANCSADASIEVLPDLILSSPITTPISHKH
ncbi:MAG: hypothetical protein R2788_19475 [Saprospiraceae bacterium]